MAKTSVYRLRLTAEQRTALDIRARTAGLIPAEFIRQQCTTLDYVPRTEPPPEPTPTLPDDLCHRCRRLHRSGCPNCPKNQGSR